MNRPAPFRQADLSRALKAAQAAGVAVGRVEIEPTGKIVMVFGKAPVPGQPAPGEPNEWDDVLK
jgi:hypothetical protein